jgi:hypothetical protein
MPADTSAQDPSAAAILAWHCRPGSSCPSSSAPSSDARAKRAPTPGGWCPLGRSATFTTPLIAPSMVILRVSAHGGRRNRRMVFTEIRLIAITENGNSIAENWHRDRSKSACHPRF